MKKYKYSTKNIVIAISFSVLWCVLAFYLIFVCSRNGSVLGAAMLFGISMVCPAVYVIILSVKSRHNLRAGTILLNCTMSTLHILLTEQKDRLITAILRQ